MYLLQLFHNSFSMTILFTNVFLLNLLYNLLIAFNSPKCHLCKSTQAFLWLIIINLLLILLLMHSHLCIFTKLLLLILVIVYCWDRSIWSISDFFIGIFGSATYIRTWSRDTWYWSNSTRLKLILLMLHLFIFINLMVLLLT